MENEYMIQRLSEGMSQGQAIWCVLERPKDRTPALDMPTV